MSDTVPAYGVFVMLPLREPGRLDEATKECADVAELHVAIDQALEHGQWQAMCIVRGEDIPLMLQGAHPPPPPDPSGGVRPPRRGRGWHA